MSNPVLVTGGNGFVGSHVVEALLNDGYAVRCLLRPHSEPKWIETLPVDIVRADYFDQNALRKAISGCRTILHFAGAVKAATYDAYLKANAQTTKALLEAASDVCPNLDLFLLCSSQAALGPSPSLDPLGEEAPPYPITSYGKSKFEAENICRQFEGKFPITIIRPPAVYGPRDIDIYIFFKLVKWWISPSIGSRNRYMSMVNALDIARFCQLLQKNIPSGFNLYHVTDGEVHSWDEVSGTIAEAMNRRPLRINVPVGVALAVSKLLSGVASVSGRMATLNREKLDDIMQSYWLISSRKAEEELGFKPEFKLREGVELTVKWYREKGWL